MTQRIFGIRGNTKPWEGCAGQDGWRIREDTSAGNEKVSDVTVRTFRISVLKLQPLLFFSFLFDWWRMKK